MNGWAYIGVVVCFPAFFVFGNEFTNHREQGGVKSVLCCPVRERPMVRWMVRFSGRAVGCIAMIWRVGVVD